MRLLFTKPTSRFTTRQWLAIGAGLAVVEGLAFAAYAFRPVPQGIDTYYSTPGEMCLARGAELLEERGEWPATKDGRDARSVIAAHCALDPDAFPWQARPLDSSGE